jgi:type VI protein secretion system component Hcp
MSDKVEILMKIVISGSSAISAESQLDILPGDDLMEGFESGRFFQIKDFNFSVGLQDDQGATGGGGETGGGGGGVGGSGGGGRAGVYAAKGSGSPYGSTREAHAMMQAGGGKGGAGKAPPPPEGKHGKDKEKPRKPGGSFGRWRREPSGTGAGARYPLEVEPISFTRLMDQASTTLLQALCDSQSIASASIVRRAAIGGDAAKAYLRLDFTDVLITSIDWDDDDLIEEKFKFICRGVQVRFRPQNSDGTLGAAISGVWPLPGK